MGAGRNGGCITRLQRRDARQTVGWRAAQESKCLLAKIFLSTGSFESIESSPAILLLERAITRVRIGWRNRNGGPPWVMLQSTKYPILPTRSKFQRTGLSGGSRGRFCDGWELRCFCLMNPASPSTRAGAIAPISYKYQKLIAISLTVSGERRRWRAIEPMPAPCRLMGGSDMARDDRKRDTPALTETADHSLVGTVVESMAFKLRDALWEAEPGGQPFTIDMTTLGGDPEMARRMIVEVDAARERLKGRRLVFVGKTVVYSAGCTFMAAFPRDDRYLTDDATLLIHCRQLKQTMELDGPIRSHLPKLTAMVHQLETGISLEEENFERLIEGSDVTMDELLEKALYNWYVTAEEACKRGLVAGIIAS
jgi:hypothetical protein